MHLTGYRAGPDLNPGRQSPVDVDFVVMPYCFSNSMPCFFSAFDDLPQSQVENHNCRFREHYLWHLDFYSFWICPSIFSVSLQLFLISGPYQGCSGLQKHQGWRFTPPGYTLWGGFSVWMQRTWSADSPTSSQFTVYRLNRIRDARTAEKCPACIKVRVDEYTAMHRTRKTWQCATIGDTTKQLIRSEKQVWALVSTTCKVAIEKYYNWVKSKILFLVSSVS